MTTDIQNLKSFDPFAEADDNGGEIKAGNQQNYIHIRIQRMYSHLFLALLIRRWVTLWRHCTHHLISNLSSNTHDKIARKADVNPAQSAMVARP